MWGWDDDQLHWQLESAVSANEGAPPIQLFVSEMMACYFVRIADLSTLGILKDVIA